MLPPQLESELVVLRQSYTVEAVEEPSVINLVIRNFPTSNLYNRPTTNLLLRVPRSFPDAGLDMFWTDIELQLSDSTTPSNAQQIEQYPALDVIPDLKGKQWRRFSWHPQKRNSAVDNLISYIEFVRRRLNQR